MVFGSKDHHECVLPARKLLEGGFMIITLTKKIRLLEVWGEISPPLFGPIWGQTRFQISENIQSPGRYMPD
jgi:hypothetical protein